MEKRKLIEGLNRDLAEELATVCCYVQQAALVTGIPGHEVREFLRGETLNEVQHALILADKIVALGGTPQAKAAGFKDLRDATAILEYDLAMERQAVKHYSERVRQAEALGELGLKVRLEEIIADETDHAEAIQRLLGREGPPRPASHRGQDIGRDVRGDRSPRPGPSEETDAR